MENLLLNQTILSQLPGLLVVSNTQSEFIYSNDYTAQTFGYHNAEQLLGDTAFQIPCPAAESAQTFLQQDKYVLQMKKSLTLFDIHRYASDEIKLLITKKSLLQDAHTVQGVICHCTEIRSDFLRHLSAKLIKLDARYHGNNRYERSYTVGNTLHETKLTPREMDCLFYMLRGQTKKEIGKSLTISDRTVETHIENIKIKLECDTRSALIDYAIMHGYLNYLPSNLIQTNFSETLD